MLPLLFEGVAQLWAYSSGRQKTQTESALMVDGDNIHSLSRTGKEELYKELYKRILPTEDNSARKKRTLQYIQNTF